VGLSEHARLFHHSAVIEAAAASLYPGTSSDKLFVKLRVEPDGRRMLSPTRRPPTCARRGFARNFIAANRSILGGRAARATPGISDAARPRGSRLSERRRRRIGFGGCGGAVCRRRS